MAGRNVKVHVEVPVQPAEAFRIFTEELDLWWVRGPVNFFDSSRAVAMRMEPGVGGRLLEMYAQDGSDMRTLGRIVDWNPGSDLAWVSPDGATIRVVFEALGESCRVEVTASLPDGAGAESTYWLRVIPPWFGSWIGRREQASRTPVDISRLSAVVLYSDPRSAAQWLTRAFGFEPPDVLDDGVNDNPWIEFRVGTSVFTVARGADTGAPSSVKLWVYVDDLDIHFERAREQGAVVVRPVHEAGFRSYEAEDLAGHRWIFAQARPTM